MRSPNLLFAQFVVRRRHQHRVAKKQKTEFVGEQNSGSESDRALQKRLYELLCVNSILAIRQTTQI